MKWLFAEAHAAIASRNTPFIIPHRNRLRQISRNRQKNFQTEPPAISSDRNDQPSHISSTID